MIVAGNDQHAAMRRGAVGVAVLQRIAGAVDAGALAVPEAEHAIDFARRVGFDLLRSQHGGGGKVLVDGGQEFDAPFAQEFFGAPEFQIDAAERRAAIAGDESGRVDAVGAIAVALVEQDAHQRLRARQQHTPAPARVSVHQGVIVEVSACRQGLGHVGLPPYQVGESVDPIGWKSCPNCSSFFVYCGRNYQKWHIIRYDLPPQFRRDSP